MPTRISYSLLATLGLAVRASHSQYVVSPPVAASSGETSSTRTYAAAGGFNVPGTPASTLETSVIPASKEASSSVSSYKVSASLSESSVVSSTSPPAQSSGGVLSSLSSYILGSSTSIATTSTNSSSTPKASPELTGPGSYVAADINETSAVHSDFPSVISNTLNASVHSGSSELTTSTVYSTNIYTVTSCAPEVTDCPGKLGAVTTELVSIGTTVCPVSALESKPPAATNSLKPQASSSLASVSSILSSVVKSANSTMSNAVSSLISTAESVVPTLSSVVNASITPSITPQTIPTAYSVSSEITTSTVSTVYTTNIYTITSCAPEVTDCPAKKGKVTTEKVSLYTTVCPVTHKVLDGVTYTPSPLAPINAAQSPPTSKPLTSTGVSAPVVSPNATLASSATSLLPSSRSVTLVNQTSAVPSVTPVELTTSIIYSTKMYTVISCPPEVTNCPGKGKVTTELISISTTVCPVSGKTTATKDVNAANTSSSFKSESLPVSTSAILSNTSLARSELTTSTVYSSSVYTVTSCAPGVSGCSSKLGSITTEMVPLYTTICPVSAALNAAEISPLPESLSPLMSSTPFAARISASESSEAVSASHTPVDTSPTIAAVNSSAASTSYIANSSTTAANSSIVKAQPSAYTTLTVYSTNVYTVTSCAPEVTNCPARLGAVTTEVIAVSTTASLVTEAVKQNPSPALGAAEYSTAAVTLSNTVGSSTMVITTVITYQDTPAPSSLAAPSSAKATAAGPSQEPTKPCTTLTLGDHFTTVIEYDALTSTTAATTATAPTAVVPASEVPKYPTGPASDAPAETMPIYNNHNNSSGSGASGTGAIAGQSTAPFVGVGSSPSYPVKPVPSEARPFPAPAAPNNAAQSVTRLQSTVTYLQTVYLTAASSSSEPPPCVPQISYVTVAATPVTVTVEAKRPFPSSSGYGVGTGNLGFIGGTGRVSLVTGTAISTATSTSLTSLPHRRWLRRDHKPGQGHGRGHGFGPGSARRNVGAGHRFP